MQCLFVLLIGTLAVANVKIAFGHIKSTDASAVELLSQQFFLFRILYYDVDTSCLYGADSYHLWFGYYELL